MITAFFINWSINVVNIPTYSGGRLNSIFIHSVEIYVTLKRFPLLISDQRIIHVLPKIYGKLGQRHILITDKESRIQELLRRKCPKSKSMFLMTN